MKVFRIAPTCGYTGGSALVCANTTEEAINLYCLDSYREDIYDSTNCTCNIINKLDYDTTLPHIMFDDIYIE